MTILSACQEAAIELNQEDVTSVFTSPSAFGKELRLQALRAAQDILQAYDWQKLTKLATLTGDGSDTSFSLPTDYDRMVKDAKVHSSSFQTATFKKADSLAEWRYVNDNAISGTPGTWIILGGEFQIYPAMALAETAKFYYVSNYIVAVDSSSAGSKTSFTADADVFVLSEKLLALGTVWRWKASKGKDYSEELRNYEVALEQETGKDKGNRILTVGRTRMGANIDFAWPGIVSP